jgi:hypothetical protein
LYFLTIHLFPVTIYRSTSRAVGFFALITDGAREEPAAAQVGQCPFAGKNSGEHLLAVGLPLAATDARGLAKFAYKSEADS